MSGDSAVQNLANRITMYETIGDNPVASIPDNVGSLGGRQIAMRQVYDGLQMQAMETIGALEPVLGDLTSICVDITLMSGAGDKVLTGREVAAAYTAALFDTDIFQRAVDSGAITGDLMQGNSTREILCQFAAYLESLSSPDEMREAALPPGLDQVSHEELQEFMAEAVTVLDPPETNAVPAQEAAPAQAQDAAPQAQDAAPAQTQDAAAVASAQIDEPSPLPPATMSEVLDGLRNLRGTDPMWETPHFQAGVDPSENTVIIGRHSLAVVRDTCDGYARDPSSNFPGFWRLLTRVCEYFLRPSGSLPSSEPDSQYERAFTYLRRLEDMQTHSDEIRAAYGRSDDEGDHRMLQLTRMTGHTRDSGGGRAMLNIVLDLPNLVLMGFAEARAAGRVEEFFRDALSTGCIPARHTAASNFLHRARSERLTSEIAVNMERMRSEAESLRNSGDAVRAEALDRARQEAEARVLAERQARDLFIPVGRFCADMVYADTRNPYGRPNQEEYASRDGEGRIDWPALREHFLRSPELDGRVFAQCTPAGVPIEVSAANPGVSITSDTLDRYVLPTLIVEASGYGEVVAVPGDLAGALRDLGITGGWVNADAPEPGAAGAA
ncbi:MAG: hypothetical protein LBD42_05635 [Desulfovibrio sp.]|jgi:hypothetical protein|nr:hypothetical protein [Desulfovibrio sp.]